MVIFNSSVSHTSNYLKHHFSDPLWCLCIFAGWCGEIRDVIFSDNGSVTVVYRVTIRGSDGEVGFSNIWCDIVAYIFAFVARIVSRCYRSIIVFLYSYRTMVLLVCIKEAFRYFGHEHMSKVSNTSKTRILCLNYKCLACVRKLSVFDMFSTEYGHTAFLEVSVLLGAIGTL